MKAAVCTEFGKPLVIEDLTLDGPKAGELRVRLQACAICHSDILYADGAWGGTLPAVYGHEASGIVEEVGPGVALAAVGDAVVVTLLRHCGRCFQCTRGDFSLCEGRIPLDDERRLHRADGADVFQGLRTAAFAEEVVVHESQVIPVGEGVPLDSAALLSCGVVTGLCAVTNTSGVETGSSVVVIGCGGVGLNSVQGALLCGASPIIAVDLSPAKLTAARRFGATHTIDASGVDVGAAVRDLTEGRGADYVFVAAGSKAAIEQGLTLSRRGGTTVLVGMTAEGTIVDFDPLEFADGGRRLLGSKMGSVNPRVDIPRLVRLYREGRLKLDELVSGHFPLEDINEAIAAATNGDALRNVIVFDGAR